MNSRKQAPTSAIPHEEVILYFALLSIWKKFCLFTCRVQEPDRTLYFMAIFNNLNFIDSVITL